MTVADLVKRFLARALGTRGNRLYIRCTDEERAAYEAASVLEDSRDASSWARTVLSREARKVLRPR